MLLCGVFGLALLAASGSVYAKGEAPEEVAATENAEVLHHKDGFHKKHMREHKPLEDKLNLTDEQKEQAKKIHEQGRKEIEPLMNEMKDLREKMDELRKKNMEEFEKILTPEQKAELDNMKKSFEEKMKNGHKHMKGKRPHGEGMFPHHDGEMLPPPFPPHGDMKGPHAPKDVEAPEAE